MLIVADSAIPFIRPVIAPLGELQLVDAPALDRRSLGRAEVLIVRSVTRVDENLLGDTQVRFVATATSGTDHIDLEWLAANGIGFADAAGCNARAVAEYVLSSLCVLDDMGRLDLRQVRVGIVGAGHVGSCLAAMLAALDIPSVLNDPPLAEQTGDSRYRPLQELRDLEVLSFHVPLTKGGSHPTINLLDRDLLYGLRPDVAVINTCRGAICNEEALLQFLGDNPEATAVIDVWRGEPTVNRELLGRATLGTPHVAGYSLDARLRATRLIRDAICRFFKLDAPDVPEPELPTPGQGEIRITEWISELDAVRSAVLASFDVRTDAARLKRMLALEPGGDSEYFSEMRRHYRYRREFSAHRVGLGRVETSLAQRLQAVGFNVTQTA